jgi:hypothetical protein
MLVLPLLSRSIGWLFPVWVRVCIYWCGAARCVAWLVGSGSWRGHGKAIVGWFGRILERRTDDEPVSLVREASSVRRRRGVSFRRAPAS